MCTIPRGKKIGCEHWEEVWGRGGEKKKKASLSSMDIYTQKALEGLGVTFEGMFQYPLEVTEICQMILVPLSGASLAAGTKFILTRMTFLIPFQSTHQHSTPSNVSPNP